ncbi:MAG: energy transducer TonB [Arcticibacter sp.]
MAQLDIFNRQWIDVVFTGRNQAYGAYQLRMDNSRITNRSMLLGGFLFVFVMSSPLIARYIKGAEGEIKGSTTELQTDVVLITPPALDESVPPPATVVEPPKPRTDQIKFVPPRVVPASQVVDEVPTVDELRVADPGPETLKGDPGAEISIDQPVGTSTTTQSAIVESEKVYDFVNLEQMPDFPGGLSKFYSYVSRNYNYPAAAREQGVSGRVIVSFIVEKDGSLTDVKLVRDMGMGTGEEAVRLLKKSPRWVAGIQNGRPVRVQYTLPIMLNLEAQ